MTSTFSPLFRVEEQGLGDNTNTWGTNVNNCFVTLEWAVAGRKSINVAGSSDYTLTTTNSTPGTSQDDARTAILDFTGLLTGNINAICPAGISKTYYVYNNTTGAFTLTFKASGGTGVAIPQGTRRVIVCDGTNCYLALNTLTAGYTKTILTSGSGTYTTPANCSRIKVRLVGGGGGGGASGTSPGSASPGGNTSFGVMTGGGGFGGTQGGNWTSGGTATGGNDNVNGGQGSAGDNRGAPAGAGSPGAPGGNSVFGGAGGGAQLGNTGGAAAPNSGSGGGGAAGDNNTNNAAGGGAGGYCESDYQNPNATYAYSVGAGGAGGPAGTGGNAGGAGAAGKIIVEEFYSIIN